jgi:GTP-binding protein
MLLIDARRGAMEADHEAMKLLDQAAVSYVVVLTKIDSFRLPSASRARALPKAELRGMPYRGLSRTSCDVVGDGRRPGYA